MGMFDTIKSSMDIGELTDVACQTKDMDSHGGSMSFFWIDPAGNLWRPDYQGTHSIEYIDDDSVSIWNRIKHVKTGVNGKLQRFYITDYITIYDAKTYPDGLTELVYCKLHFILGKLQSFEYINN